jgi:hypothetical protein
MEVEPRSSAAHVAGRLIFPASLVLLFGSFATLLVWNALHYDWLRGYDAWQNWRYEQAIAHGHLPSRAETDEWHNPPLFYVAARAAQWLAGSLGADKPEQGAQFIGVASGIGLAVLALLIARELFRRSRTAQLAALGFAIATPVLVRGSIMYHPEPLASLFVAAATFVVVRALVRNRLTIANGAVAGMLIGLGCLTRTWALASLLAVVLVLIVAAIWQSDRRASLRMLASFAVAAFVLTAPWLVYKGIRFGSPLAYSRPVAEQWQQRGRPVSFYITLSLPKVFSSPYVPNYRNRLLPVVYTDWWGDYWRYFRVPPTMINQPDRLPDPYQRDLVRQSYVGILPSALAVFGFFGLGWRAVRRKSLPLLALLVPLVLLGIAFVGFLVKYPKLDGDNIKALYILGALVPLSVCAGWVLDHVLRFNRLVFAAVVLLLVDVAFLDARFLILPA